MRYAIWIQIDDDEWDYLRERDADGKWTSMSNVMLFDNKDDAIAECHYWNTATVTEWRYDDKLVD